MKAVTTTSTTGGIGEEDARKTTMTTTGAKTRRNTRNGGGVEERMITIIKMKATILVGPRAFETAEIATAVIVVIERGTKTIIDGK